MGLRGGLGSSDEGPALHYLDDEVLAGGERLVAVRGAALRAPQVQVAVEPDTELATGQIYYYFSFSTNIGIEPKQSMFQLNAY